MTPFQEKILNYIQRHEHATTWEIAMVVFPEKWTKKHGKKYSGRGALIGHIDRAASKLPQLTRLPPNDRFGVADFWLI